MTGTFINVSTVLMSGTVGALVGVRLPERFRQTTMHAIGLVTPLNRVSDGARYAERHRRAWQLGDAFQQHVAGYCNVGVADD